MRHKFNLSSYSTKTEYFLESDNHGSYFKIVLPVQKAQNVEKTAFVVNGNETVSDLLHSVSHTTDATKLQFLDNDGIRISGSTNLSSLLLTNFKFQHDQTTHNIESRVCSTDGSTLSPTQLDSIKILLKSQKTDKLPLSTFLQLTKEKELSESTSIIALKVLSRNGWLLYFSQDKELSQTIFLKPETVANSIEKSLIHEQFRVPLKEKLVTLNILKKKKKRA